MKACRLTGFAEKGAPLIDGGSQGRRTDTVEADLFDAFVKDSQQRLLFLPLGQDFIVDEGGEHLGLDEAAQKG